MATAVQQVSPAPSATKRPPLLRGTLTRLNGWWTAHPKHPGHEVREAILEVWCPFCQQYHVHGWSTADGGRVKTHRVAHCTDPSSPFHEGGYLVSTICQGHAGYESHVVRPGQAIVRKAREVKEK